MKFLYATDLHGDTDKYETILDYAVENDIGLIHLGADILPKGRGIIEVQSEFVNGYLRGFMHRCTDKGIKVLTMFGNDDLYFLKDIFRKYASLLDESPVILDDIVFSGYPFVPDYPFSLVTACKYDYEGWVPEHYRGNKCDLVDGKVSLIKDPKAYFKAKGTIKSDLDKISASFDTVMAIHTPPTGLGLDVCYGKQTIDLDVLLGIKKAPKKAPKPTTKEVGSRSVLEWIERVQPRLVLCGHIHESPKITDTWMAKVGRTVVIQPGQGYSGVTVVVVTLGEEDTYERMIL